MLRNILIIYIYFLQFIIYNLSVFGGGWWWGGNKYSALDSAIVSIVSILFFSNLCIYYIFIELWKNKDVNIITEIALFYHHVVINGLFVICAMMKLQLIIWWMEIQVIVRSKGWRDQRLIRLNALSAYMSKPLGRYAHHATPFLVLIIVKTAIFSSLIPQKIYSIAINVDCV